MRDKAEEMCNLQTWFESTKGCLTGNSWDMWWDEISWERSHERSHERDLISWDTSWDGYRGKNRASELIAHLDRGLKQTKPSLKPKPLLFREKSLVWWGHRYLFCLFPGLCGVFVCQQSNCGGMAMWSGHEVLTFTTHCVFNDLC